MKHFTKYGFFLALVSTTTFAYEPAQGWYAGFFGGLSFAPSQTFDFQHTYRSGQGQGKIKYYVLGDGGVQLGYRCDKFRYEGEFLYNQNNMQQINFGNITIEHDTKTPRFSLKGGTALVAGYLNGYYEFYDEDYSDAKLVPYLGLGVGYASTRSIVRFYYNQTILNQARNSVNASSMIGQGIAGLNYFFSDTFSLGTDFRYMSTKKFNRFDARIQAMNWNILVFNFSFDQPAY